ncbi:MAG: PQQ-binding-like beta-propeller repeat protein, partial [Thermoguttaceae bacterium]|nr:PQQ-binding-like beta-propeller repeat protein [Thermoguttaceae bacterium]
MFSPLNRTRNFVAFLLFFAVFTAGLCVTSVSHAQGVWKGYIIPQAYANSQGLERQWIAKTDFNPYTTAAEHLHAMIFDRDAVFTVTGDGTVQAFEAETGKTKWLAYTKTKGRLVQGLAASRYYVAFTAGSTLYVLNRENGRILLDATVPAIPTNDLTLGECRAYVPAINGLVYIFNLQPMEDPFKEFGVSESSLTDRERQARHQEFINSLRLEKAHKEPESIRSIGALKVSPVTTRCSDGKEFVAWPTGSELVTLSEVRLGDEGGVVERYNIPTMGESICPVAYKAYDPTNPNNTGIVFAGTLEGFVYALREASGKLLWRFPTGEIIKDAPVYVDNELFVITTLSGMYCLDAETGGDGKSADAKWFSPGICKFVACSKQRVYALDQGHMMLILDRVSGQKISSIPMMDYKFICVNTQNDRIYFATETGVVQCLREIALTTPLDYAAAWRTAREVSIKSETAAAHAEKKKTATKKKNADRMGDDEDGGWGVGDDDDDDDDDDMSGDDDDDDDDDTGDDDDDDDDDDDEHEHHHDDEEHEHEHHHHDH